MEVVVGLGAAAIAILAVLCSIAVDWLIQCIARGLPSINILSFTLKLGGIFSDYTDNILNWCVDLGVQYFGDAANWFLVHAYVLSDFSGKTVAAVQHLGDQIAHLSVTTIPNAISDAHSYADTQVTDLRNDLAARITNVANAAASALTGDINGLTATVAGDVRTIDGQITNAISSAVSTAEEWAGTEIAKLQAYVDARVSDAETTASQDLAYANAQLTGLVAAAASTAETDLGNAENYLSGQIGAAETAASTALSGAVGTLTGEITGAETAASTALSGAVGALGGEITASTIAASTALSGAVGTLTGEINSTGSKLESEIGTVTGELDTDVGTVTGSLSDLETSLPGLIAAAISAALVSPLARIAAIEECYVGTCGGTNSFSSLLQDALSVGEFAGVFSFLNGVISDPVKAESDYADTIGTLYSGGQSLFDSLLSL